MPTTTAEPEDDDVAKSPRNASRRSRLTAGVEASMRPWSGVSDVSAPVISIDSVIGGERHAAKLHAAALRHELDISAEHSIATDQFDAVQDDLVDGNDLNGRGRSAAAGPADADRRQRQLHARAVDPDVGVLDPPREQRAEVGADVHVAQLSGRGLTDGDVVQRHGDARVDRGVSAPIVTGWPIADDTCAATAARTLSPVSTVRASTNSGKAGQDDQSTGSDRESSSAWRASVEPAHGNAARRRCSADWRLAGGATRRRRARRGRRGEGGAGSARAAASPGRRRQAAGKSRGTTAPTPGASSSRRSRPAPAVAT